MEGEVEKERKPVLKRFRTITLFGMELEMFKPLSQRLDATTRDQTLALSDLGTAYKVLVSFAGHSKLGNKKGEKAKLS